MSTKSNIIRILKDTQQKKGYDGWTHVCIGNFYRTSGVYALSQEAEFALKTKLNDQVKSDNVDFSIAEKQDNISYIIIDLEFKYNIDNKISRIYSKEMFDDIADEYMREIRILFDIPESFEYNIWFFEKENPTVYCDKFVKDGIHIIIDIACSKDERIEFRNQILDTTEIILNKHGIMENIVLDIDNVVDKRAHSVPWFMYGCAREKSIPYLLTSGYVVKHNNINKFSDEEVQFMKDNGNLVYRFSVRNRKQFVFRKNASSIWYEFKNHRWVKSDYHIT